VTTTSDRRKRDENREHHDETPTLTEAEIQARLEAVEKERDDAKEVCELVEAQCGDWKRRALNAEAALDIFRTSGAVGLLERAGKAEADLAAARTQGAREALLAAADAWQQGEWINAPIRPTMIQERIARTQHVTDWLRARAEGGGS
jgi:hypothetical protein